ncbi:hypothetical protein CEXT_387561 [Caerostris extrusa]|uniref:Uncharacterized protein n=1 Tax=Caerostris extrusa TaxID=172846 RepID=A0AAV4PNP0_CAEEX|nr:hypothetical protein CEXT_387561 [Caerostris extrusa]
MTYMEEGAHVPLINARSRSTGDYEEMMQEGMLVIHTQSEAALKEKYNTSFQEEAFTHNNRGRNGQCRFLVPPQLQFGSKIFPESSHLSLSPSNIMKGILDNFFTVIIPDFDTRVLKVTEFLTFPDYLYCQRRCNFLHASFTQLDYIRLRSKLEDYEVSQRQIAAKHNKNSNGYS